MSGRLPAGEPWQWTAAAAAAAVRDGTITPLELVESVLGRIDAVEPAVNAFVVVDRDGAEAQARELSDAAAAGAWRGVLHGVPIAIKDIFDVEGWPTRCGSPLYDDVSPARADALVVASLRAAGAVIVGKTHTHELACGVYTEPTNNPWDLDRSSGGSSGGSGAAVAAGEAMAATGSDTGGSIRIPAAVCGIVGIKPTYRLLSTTGVAALSWSLDHVGPLARTVEDAALVLQAMLGPVSPEPVWPVAEASLEGVRLGVVVDDVFSRVSDPVQDAFEAACSAFSAAGAEIVDISVPELADTLPIEFTIVMAEAAAYHAKAIRERPAAIGEGIRALFQAGALLPADDYLLAQRLRGRLQSEVASAYAENALDAIVAPTIPVPPYTSAEATLPIGGVDEPVIEAVVRTTAPFNLTGLPVVSVPMGVTPDGLPVALQLAGKPYGERRLIAIAACYERIRPGRAFDELHPIHRSEFGAPVSGR